MYYIDTIKNNFKLLIQQYIIIVGYYSFVSKFCIVHSLILVNLVSVWFCFVAPCI